MTLVAPDAETAGAWAARIVAEALEDSEQPVLGLATGSSPMTTWDALAAQSHDLSRVRAFALDEYVGLPCDHPSPTGPSSIGRSSVGSAWIRDWCGCPATTAWNPRRQRTPSSTAS